MNDVSDLSDYRVQDVDRMSIPEMVQEEFKKLVKGKGTAEETPLATSYFADFVGMSSLPNIRTNMVKWIIDSGASNHICSDIRLLTNLRKISGKNTIQIPDGSIKFVKLIVNAILRENLVLHDVLFVPDFKYNFIYVAKLQLHSDKQLSFYGYQCILWDQSRKCEIGRNIGNLYFFEGLLDISITFKIGCNI